MENKEPVTWSPWHGCHKCSPGCQNCFVYAMDKRFGRDTAIVAKTKDVFNTPIKKNRQKEWKYPAGTVFKTCFTSDFFIEDADEWRDEAWAMIRQRKDCIFMIATKRIDRMKDCLPADWGDGWDNVIISVSCENQAMADKRLPIFLELPIKHRCIFLAPLLEYVDLKGYLSNKIEKVSVGGEAYAGARECKAEWIEQIYLDCKNSNMTFEFHQIGTNFTIDGKRKAINVSQQWAAAEQFQKILEEKYKE